MNPAPPLSGIWAIAHDAPWLWESFEDAHFLFNPLSNETHVLNAGAVEMLEILRQGPATLPEILQRLEVTMDPAPYRELLGELDRFGLITPVAT